MPEEVRHLREQADRARRLAAGVSVPALREDFTGYAAECEARAAELLMRGECGKSRYRGLRLAD